MFFLETKGIVKQFAGHRALNDVGIEVSQGKIFGLLGPNGAGKTTLIRVINRIIAPDSGEVYIEGNLSQPSDIYRIGYLPEERGLYKKMKVGDQAVYLAQLKGLTAPEAKRRLKIWFEKFDIMNWWNKNLEELSKGMQQKVQFIVTVIHEPELLIFDEPFSGFDPINTEQLKKEILELKASGRTIIFSTHNMASVEEICDDIALINRSEVVLSGQVDEVRRKFKSNTFKVNILNDELIHRPDYFTVISDFRDEHKHTVRIRKEMEITNSELISVLAGGNEIMSFEEELPSMNEVFLNVVRDQELRIKN
ncbi:MAG: ATP-binding cassette domain-containing protein [Tannerella sp.]|jgi:ABC-2 type transport system ATP-binding protein|nr:ATP-binding cassette domain-containing protein [Tannerella sp.]